MMMDVRVAPLWEVDVDVEARITGTDMDRWNMVDTPDCWFDWLVTRITFGGCPPGWDTIARPWGLLLMVILTGDVLPGVDDAVVYMTRAVCVWVEAVAAPMPSMEMLRRWRRPSGSSSSSGVSIPLMWIDVPLGSTTTLDVGLLGRDGLVATVVIVVGAAVIVL